MYRAFFKLHSKPFELVPDPRFIYLSGSHRKALTYLDYGIRDRAGFILLTGEVGSGKTTLIQDLIQRKYDRVVLAKVFNTKADSLQLLSMINDDFGLDTGGKDKVALMRDLNDFLVRQFADGNQPILIIDEAQNLGPELLEEVRMLSNLESSQSKLLQIVLVGQPELRETLALPELRQLRQRISVNCHLRALNREEVQQYIEHRMEVAGNSGALTFTPESIDELHRYSRGIPRLINICCDFILLSAFAEESAVVTEDIVWDVVGELDFETHFWGPSGSAPAAPAASAGPPSAAAPVAAPAVTAEVSAALQTVCDRIDSFKNDLLRQVDKHEAQVDELRSKVEEISFLVETLAAERPYQSRAAVPGFARRIMDGISGYGGRK